MDPLDVAQTIAESFARRYHQIFAANPADAAQFYRPNSFLHFDNGNIQGYERILDKFSNLNLQQWKHTIISVEGQPSSIPGSVLVFINGEVVCLQDVWQFTFTLLETFQLVLENDGGYYIRNHHSRVVNVASQEVEQAVGQEVEQAVTEREIHVVHP